MFLQMKTVSAAFSTSAGDSQLHGQTPFCLAIKRLRINSAVVVNSTHRTAMAMPTDETGGLTIGYAGTDYDTYLSNLTSQKISYAQFNEQYVAKYEANKTSFEDAMKNVEKLFGLKLKGDANDKLVLTAYEVQRLKNAYTLAMSDYDSSKYTQEQYVLYGTYNPFSVTVTHILNSKSGIDFTSYSHTGLSVAVFADGTGADSFKGYYDNTRIYTKLATMLKVR